MTQTSEFEPLPAVNMSTKPSLPGSSVSGPDVPTKNLDDRMSTFRTVTSVISIIQKQLQINCVEKEAADSITMGKDETRQLYALNSLASLFVRDRVEVVAVAVQTQPLGFVACTSTPNEPERSLSRDGFIFTDFVTMRNPPSVSENPGSRCNLVAPQPEGIDLMDPIDYLLQHW
jgi:hypothetical protein